MTIQISSPVAGASVSGTVNLVGTSGGVTLQAMDGATPLGSTVLSSPLPFTIPVDTTKLANGAQTLSVGDGTNTATVAIVVNNVVTPPVVLPSPDGSTIPALSQIVDAAGHVWTVPGGVVQRDGVAAGFTDQVTALLYYQGTLWQENVNSLWWPWSTTSSSWTGSGVADPRVPVVVPPPGVTSAIPFFGTNGHYVQGGLFTSVALATQAASLADLGMKGYRQDMYSAANIDTVAATVIPGLGKNVQVLPLVIPYPWNDSASNGNPTEATAYAYAFSMAAHAATKFAGVPVVEFGNEYDLDSHNKALTNDGVNVSDYDNSTWPIWRGAMRGAYDGWRSVDTTGVTKIINTASAGYVHLGWYQGMLTGTQPDGSTGHPVVKTDIIQLHWYSDGGDFESATGSHGGTVYNVLALLKAAYNLPIMFTEIGVNADFSTAQGQAYVTKTIKELVAAKATYNVIGFNWYELYDDAANGGDGNFGLMSSGTVKKPLYATMKAAIAANPMG